MPVHLSQFAQTLQAETAFTVLAAARRLQAGGKRIIELEIGDSPFPSTASATREGIAAIEAGDTHYGPSAGLPELREAAAAYVNSNYGLAATAANVVVGPGAKVFELWFCEALVDPGDGVLVFSPYFPTYPANIARRGARMCLAPLEQRYEFRPQRADVERFLATDPRPRAIFLNSPHNPTGGVATRDDLKMIADLIRGRDVAVFSDEPYDRMVWRGRHESIAALPGMLDQCVAAYTFSKSYSMSGWRLGFAVTSTRLAETLSALANTSLSCVPPFVQRAGAAALGHDSAERDEQMAAFRRKVERLVRGLNCIDGIRCLDPAGTFYAFPNVSPICNRLKITSHGLAMYLLEGADDRVGVACLGGECFGDAGGGFLRFSCAQPDEAIDEALALISRAVIDERRVERFLSAHGEYCLASDYPTPSS
ncbi:MAG: aminotransferase class I/II-fold pyridoxal phosphate-dependent enzyme [Pirellulales bacterium]|nr:aminotransferase class I/II-fold pyridoxal phosphate-dependent enzyme [Pirellulales bacterium]